MGKANSANPQVVATRKLVIGVKAPIIKGQADSVSGLRHPLVRVGTAAKASLAIAKMIAMFGLLVRYQRTMASPDSVPQR